jgi:hypothetical protein
MIKTNIRIAIPANLLIVIIFSSYKQSPSDSFEKLRLLGDEIIYPPRVLLNICTRFILNDTKHHSTDCKAKKEYKDKY